MDLLTCVLLTINNESKQCSLTPCLDLEELNYLKNVAASNVFQPLIAIRTLNPHLICKQTKELINEVYLNSEDDFKDLVDTLKTIIVATDHELHKKIHLNGDHDNYTQINIPINENKLIEDKPKSEIKPNIFETSNKFNYKNIEKFYRKDILDKHTASNNINIDRMISNNDYNDYSINDTNDFDTEEPLNYRKPRFDFSNEDNFEDLMNNKRIYTGDDTSINYVSLNSGYDVLGRPIL